MVARIKFTVLILFFCFNGFSQELVCGTEATGKDIEAMRKLDVQSLSRIRTASPIKIAITAHIVRRSDGTGGLTASELSSAINDVNNIYTLTNMEFFIFGDINYIDSDEYFDFSSSQETELSNQHFVENTINVYFFNSATSGESSVCGYARFPQSGIDRIVMVNACTTNGSTFPHELGHYFALYHTHGKTNNDTTDELVTRGDGANCETAGDDLCDTAADPNLSGQVDANCSYIGGATDTNGDSYAPNPRNLMSYSQKHCRDEFSQGQADRIVAAYLEYKTYLYDKNYAAIFDASVREVCENGSVEFVDESVNAVSYSWTFEGGTPASSIEANPTVTYATAGNYDVSLVITEAGGQTDTKTFENFVSVKGEISSEITANSGSFEEFEIEEPIYNEDGATTWTKTGTAFSEGSSSVFMNFYSYSAVGAEDYLTVATLNTSVEKIFALTFDYAYAPYDGTYFDGLEVVYRDPCGEWQSAWLKEGADLATVENQTSSFVPTSEQWNTETVVFSIDESVDVTEFAFKSINGYGNNLYVDNYSIDIFDPSFTITDVIVTDATCPDRNDGSMEVFVSSPGNFDYSIDGEVYAASSTIRNLYPGTYQVIARNFVGTEESMEVTVGSQNDFPETPVISLNGDKLSITLQEGYEAQWYINNLLIVGATGSEVALEGQGSYTVSVTNAGCTIESDPFIVLSSDFVNSQLSIYPNPVEDYLSISIPEELKADISQIIINDLSGRQLRVIDFQDRINVSDLFRGLYIIHFQLDGENVNRRFLKE